MQQLLQKRRLRFRQNVKRSSACICLITHHQKLPPNRRLSGVLVPILRRKWMVLVASDFVPTIHAAIDA